MFLFSLFFFCLIEFFLWWFFYHECSKIFCSKHYFSTTQFFYNRVDQFYFLNLFVRTPQFLVIMLVAQTRRGQKEVFTSFSSFHDNEYYILIFSQPLLLSKLEGKLTKISNNFLTNNFSIINSFKKPLPLFIHFLSRKRMTENLDFIDSEKF